MADGNLKPPMPGDMMDGYRYLGGDPSKEENWISAEAPKAPAAEMKPSFGGEVYGAGKSIMGAIPKLLPAGAAIAAGAAEPLAAPITAPLAYAATEGLVSPKEIQQHPVREGLTAASMAIPGPAEAVGYAFPRFAVEHPTMMRAGGTVLGGLIGAGAGDRAGGGRYGELGGGVGGAFLGYGLGGREVAAQGEKLIQDTLQGARPLGELPERLLPAYMRQSKALADAHLQLALERGEQPDMIKIPVGRRSQVQNMYEERAKMKPLLPGSIVSPEQYESSLARLKSENAGFDPLAEETRRKASAGGMAHAAESHRPEFVPSRRGKTTTLSQSFRLRGKRPQ